MDWWHNYLSLPPPTQKMTLFRDVEVWGIYWVFHDSDHAKVKHYHHGSRNM